MIQNIKQSAKLIFTVCTANRMGMAVALAQSALKYNPDYQLIVFIPDYIQGRINKADFPNFTIISIEDIQLGNDAGFVNALKNPNKLCNSMKSWVGLYLVKNYKPPVLIYLDTDMLVFDSFTVVENVLKEYPIVLTPALINAYEVEHPDEHAPNGVILAEYFTIITGNYNAGFWAVNPSNLIAEKFLYWWKERTVRFGDLHATIYDQNWLNFVPIYFKNSVKLLEDWGYNVAVHNFHERIITEENGSFFVNKVPLVCMHFSGYNYEQSHQYNNFHNDFAKFHNECTYKILSLYKEQLDKGAYAQYAKLPFLYYAINPIKESFSKKLFKSILNKLNSFFKKMGYTITIVANPKLEKKDTKKNK
ncbi:MAG: hypothetical protein QM528_08450 [Phycisphaerales bacterium]|nr:hypothetical protein [Phycisphaerales bacterium]